MNPLYGRDHRQLDAYSTGSGSGDSIFIGVEDDQDFRDYEGHKNVSGSDLALVWCC